MLLWILLAVGLIIIAGLAWYAGTLLMQLKHQTETQKAIEAENSRKIEQRNQNIAQSIDTIIAAMLEEQCDYSEGTIRLCVLLDHMHLGEAIDVRVEYPELHRFYDNIKHMATHKARADLPKKERMKQDVERLKHEAESQPIIKEHELPALKRFIAAYL
ncbi:DUF2489 domain-containing protein [Alteromonas sp. a30]|uniref:DUF2489 domain-containing protein n=1 Tax=Alteromonas sp. a30 TaxID=2730917 RepID=UPI00227F7D25|nr:DUF2489 domain-containing protein [Alteromonas sp. a30]MCY7295522.1 DUF2489 domain-containing protein [Alteromonas sp. a30]